MATQLLESPLTLTPGTVVWAAPDPTVGVEQAGRRPFVVVASMGYLRHVTQLILAVPVTTCDRGWPNHVRLRGTFDLESESWAMTEQLRAVSRARISKTIGVIDAATVKDIQSWLRDFLGL